MWKTCGNVEKCRGVVFFFSFLIPFHYLIFFFLFIVVFIFVAFVNKC